MNLRWIVTGALLLAVSCRCSDGRPRSSSVTEASLNGATLHLQLFFHGHDRARAADSLGRLDDSRGALVGYARDRHIHLFGESLATDFDVAFLDGRFTIREIASLKRDDVLPLPPNSDHTSPRGITSSEPSRYALLLRPGWLKEHSVSAGSSLFTGTLLRTPEPLPELHIDSKTISVEVAITEEQRQRGLMHRPRLGADDGMLFVYSYESPHEFWMRHTLIPLDIAFLRADGEVANVVETPVWKDPVNDDGARSPSEGPCQYVLEVNFGWFRKHGLLDESGKIKPGTRVQIPDSCR